PLSAQTTSCPASFSSSQSASVDEASSSTSRTRIILGVVERQLEVEDGARAERRLDADASAVRGHDLPRDPEAEPETAVRGLGHAALEALEDPLPVALGDAVPLVAHLDPPAVGRTAYRDRNRLAAAELDRVRQQVRDDLVDGRRIPPADDGL